MIKTVIVDDEPLALKHLALMLQKYEASIAVQASAQSVDDAIEAICEHNPDVVFLDIDIDGRSSFEILAAFPERKFDVVFITAFDEYGIQAIKENALDYILKPVNSADLYNAVQRIEKKRGEQSVNRLVSATENRKYRKISVPTADGLLFLETESIVYCESEGRYTRFYLKTDGEEKKVLVSKNIGEYEDLLPPDVFVRIHHHYIINLRFINRYIKGNGGTIIMKNGVELPVSKRKKEDFLRSIGSL